LLHRKFQVQFSISLLKWVDCCFIREQLGLQEEPTLVDVENLLRATEPSSFGSELLTCLLKTVLPDSHPMTAKLNENTWPVILRKWLREEQPRLCFDTSFPQLQMEQKLDLLSYLAHVALDSVAIRQILDETAETGPAGESEAAPQRPALELSKLRSCALGNDRYFNRYWFWRSAGPRIWVESLQDSQEGGASGPLPRPLFQSSWAYYDSPKQVEELLAFLDDRGIREKELKANLQQRHKEIEAAMNAHAES
jgi:hypothetical protein